MVELKKGKAKVLTSQLAKESGSVDPRAQISAEEIANKYDQYEEERATEGICCPRVMQ
jgi:hypothetical protein